MQFVMKQVLTCLVLSNFVLVCLAVQEIKNPDKYPACIDDSDCEKANLGAGHACFQVKLKTK